MADTLITKLSGVPGIALRPLSAVQRQTKDGADAVGVGRIVRADAVVEGSLQHVRDRLRVTVRLIAVADGHAMWGETFDTDATDVFAVQDAIAQRVAASLKPHLSSEARAGLGRRGTADLAAYNAYLKGRYFWNRRTEADFRKAIGHFKQAIAADPTYALAHSGLADCYSLLSIWGAAPPKETLDEARLAASRAVAAAGDSFGEPYASAALVRWIYEWDWEGADSAFGRAIALNPSYATAHQWYAYYLASRGRFDEAIARIRRAQELDPLSVSIATDVGEIHCWGGRYDEALAHIGAALDMEPNFPLAHNVLGTIQLKRGRVAEAIEELERAFRMDDSPRFVATLGHAYGVANRRADARAMEARLSALEKTRYISRFHLALIAAGLGEDDRAFTLLDQAFRERSDNMAILRVHPLLEKLRGDPRFDELMRRVDSSAD
jgi:tetratricopeptide (TPR) repeat protein